MVIWRNLRVASLSGSADAMPAVFLLAANSSCCDCESPCQTGQAWYGETCRSCFSRVRQMPCLLHSYFLFAAISSCDLCDSEWHTGSVSDLAGAWPGSQTAGSQSWRVQGTQFPPNLLKSRIRGISQQKVGHTPQQNHTPRPRLLVPDTSDIIGGAARLLPPLPFLRTTSTCCSLCLL
jgi:hypothetical protein